MIINTDLKKCEVCKRHFIKLEIHHIDGNHENNNNRNIIKICQSCHKSIHKNINSRRNREYNLLEEEEDRNTNENIYNLRVKLHKSRYGNLKNIPNDNITKIAKFNIYMRNLAERNKLKFDGVKEIIIPYG